MIHHAHRIGALSEFDPGFILVERPGVEDRVLAIGRVGESHKPIVAQVNDGFGDPGARQPQGLEPFLALFAKGIRGHQDAGWLRVVAEEPGIVLLHRQPYADRLARELDH